MLVGPCLVHVCMHRPACFPSSLTQRLSPSNCTWKMCQQFCFLPQTLWTSQENALVPLKPLVWSEVEESNKFPTTHSFHFWSWWDSSISPFLMSSSPLGMAERNGRWCWGWEVRWSLASALQMCTYINFRTPEVFYLKDKTWEFLFTASHIYQLYVFQI